MKTVSATYQGKEEARTRKPAELYHIWRDGGDHWYYTSGDVAVVFGGNTYTPATVLRGSVQWDSKMEVSTLDVQFSRVTTPTVDFIAQNPVEMLWISVSRVFRDQTPYEAGVVFVGQIKSSGIKGAQLFAKCVGFEHYLSLPVPRFRYQPQCNHTLFDARCALASASYKISTTILSITWDGLKVTSTDFDAQDDGYFNFGYLSSGDYKRLICEHVGSYVYLRYSIPGLAIGDAVDVYPGCDGRIETCRDKFDNIVHFLGFPYIPKDNPTLWA